MKGKCPLGTLAKAKKKLRLTNKAKRAKPIMIETSYKELKQKNQTESLGNDNKRFINTVEGSIDVLNLSKINIGINNMMRVSNSLNDLNHLQQKNQLKDRYQQANSRTSFSFISDSNEEDEDVKLNDLNETPTTICNYYQQSEQTSEKKANAYNESMKRNLNNIYKNMPVEKKQTTKVGAVIQKGDGQLPQTDSVIKVVRKPKSKKKNVNTSIMSLSSLSSVINDNANDNNKEKGKGTGKSKTKEFNIKNNNLNNSKGKKPNNTYSKVNNRSSSLINNANMNQTNYKQNFIITNKQYVNYNDNLNHKVSSNKKTVHKPLVLYFDKVKFEGHLMMSPMNTNEKGSSTKREYQINSNKSTIPSSSSAAKIKINQRQSKGISNINYINDMKISKTITEFTLHQKYISAMKLKEKMDQTPKADRFKYIHINKNTSLTHQQEASSAISNLKNYTSNAKQSKPTPNHYLKTASLQQNKVYQSVFVFDEQQQKQRVPQCVTSNKKNGYNLYETAKYFKKENTQSSIKRNTSSISMIDSKGSCSVKQKLLDKMNKAVNHNLLYEIHNAYKNQICSNISPILKSGKNCPLSSNKKEHLAQNTSLHLGRDTNNNNNNTTSSGKRFVNNKNMSDIIVTPNKFSFSSNKKKNLGYYCMNSNMINDDFFNS